MNNSNSTETTKMPKLAIVVLLVTFLVALGGVCGLIHFAYRAGFQNGYNYKNVSLKTAYLEGYTDGADEAIQQEQERGQK